MAPLLRLEVCHVPRIAEVNRLKVAHPASVVGVASKHEVRWRVHMPQATGVTRLMRDGGLVGRFRAPNRDVIGERAQ